jgi:hypothetical protein
MANIQQQIQIHDILKDGEIVDLMPITTAQDVQVGKQETGSLTLPGSDGSEVLSETLSNIRKYLFNLSSLASMARKASSNPNDASEINIPTTAVTTKLTNSIEEMVLRVDTLETTVEKKVAPTSHSSENNTYGIGNTTMYGHVKLSDIYKSEVANGNANSGVGASQKAIYDTYTTLLSSTAPTSHASALNTYGVASKTEYGHVKLSDEYEKKVGNGDAANGMAASQNALYNAYNYLYEERLSINGGTILGEIKFGDIHGDNSNGIYPTGTLSGTLGGTNNRWKNAYTAEIDNSGEINTNSLCVTATITENGTTLADKYAAKSHTHSYLPLSGGTVTGDLIADDIIATRISGVTITENGTTLADKYAAKSHTHSYLPLSGGTVTGDLKFAESGTTIRGISGRVGTNDAWRVVGGATGENGGYLEIATTDDGNEPIYVRQYKDGDGGGFTKNIIARTATLLDASGNTSFPGTISEGGTSLENKYAPYNHAIGSNSYGGATSTNYGHVKLTDDISDTDASYSIAVSPAALRRSICADGAGAHNAIYRGKYLGDTYTPAQQNAISDGTFDDLFIGDYWTKTSTVNGTSYTNTYIIAGFDYWKRPKPDNTNPTATNVRYRHHCIIVPEKIMYIEKMNSKVTNSGGYLSSSMYSSGLKLAINIAYAVFGESQIGSLSRYVSSDINSSGVITKASVDYNAEISLMDSTMLFGIPIFVGSTKSTLYDPCPQFPLFRYNPEYINCTDNYWLTDIFLENSYGVATSIGRVTTYSPTANNGVRPYITII